MAARSSSRMCSYIVVAVVFSIPPKMKSLTTTCAYLFHGYVTPVSSPKWRIISGVRPKVRRAVGLAALRHEVRERARRRPRRRCAANSPATSVKR